LGLNIKELITKKEIEIKDLNNKILAIDTFNILYQFLTTIRQHDGTPLINKKGEITSHLNGLFFRTAKLLKAGIKPVFVFDGTPPDLKKQERERRKLSKQQAKAKYEEAKESKDISSMKKYASRTAYLTSEMVEQAKELITLLGLPIIQAPSEGEAQAAYLVKNKDAYAAVSQDYDTLLYETPLLIHNLSIAGRKKLRNKLSYKTVKPEIIHLKEILTNLEINQEQLIILSILIGTDYNKSGVKGIGPKTALKLVKEYKDNYNALFKKVEFEKHSSNDWKTIYNTFKNMPITKDYKIKFTQPDIPKLKAFLIEKHDFSQIRIENALKDLIKEKTKQQSLANF